MVKALDIISTTINFASSFILICNAISYWIQSAIIGRYGRFFGFNPIVSFIAINGIYMAVFAIFIIGSEIGLVSDIYHRYFGFFMKPYGRGVAYIFFSLLTFSLTWHGIVSFLLLIIFGIGAIVLNINIPKYKYYPIIGTVSTPEAQSTNQLEEQTSLPITSSQISMPEPSVHLK